jgi:hypothetical protein
MHNCHVILPSLLALAILGGATQIGSFLLFCCADQGDQGKYSSDSNVTVADGCANKLCQWEQSISYYIPSATVTRDSHVTTTVLALVTLGGCDKKIEMILSVSRRPR